MNKIVGGLCAVVATLGLSAPVLAQQVTVLINGTPAQFDQPPIMQGGRVLVPMRGIFETLGASVVYLAPTQQIRATQGQTMVELQIGSREASINGRHSQLDVPAQTVGGRTMVPLRFVSESLGADVKWDPPSSTVSISFQKAGREEYHPAPPPRPPVPRPVPPPPQPRPHVLEVRVLAPPNHQGVPGQFNFELATEPGARVDYIIEVRPPAPPGVRVPNQVKRGRTAADSTGHVVIPVNLVEPLGTKVVLKATAYDARGMRSREARVDVTRL